MGLTTAQVQATYRSIRTALPCAAVAVRDRGSVYQGTRGVPLAAGMELGRTGSQTTGDEAVRLLVSELREPRLKAGDEIEVQDATGAWTRHTVTGARYDQAQATVLIEYAAEGM